MRATRRQLLKGTAATALLAQTHLLARARPAAAAGADDPILVLVNLQGGNDALNSLIPVDDAGAPQRSLYESLRPDLAIGLRDLDETRVGSDPVRGTGLALHPNLIELATLFDQGRLALVSGIGVADSSLSHSGARDAWFTGDPRGNRGTGWIGRQLDAAGPSPDPRAVSFGAGVHPSLSTPTSNALGTRRLAGFTLPRPAVGGRDVRRRAWEAIYAEGREPASLGERAARSGRLVLSGCDRFESIDVDGWGGQNGAPLSGLGYALRDVASILRYDLQNPGDATSLRFFHVEMGSYDTHANQGTTGSASGHGRLLRNLSTALYEFQRDLSAIGVADRVVTLVYSEFGRRACQNGSRGTDHGRAGLAMLMGEAVAGGLYGEMPDLGDLDADGNPRVTTDFRRVYATLIDQWLGGDHTAVLPDGPFEPLPLLAYDGSAQTPDAVPLPEPDGLLLLASGLAGLLALGRSRMKP